MSTEGWISDCRKVKYDQTVYTAISREPNRNITGKECFWELGAAEAVGFDGILLDHFEALILCGCPLPPRQYGVLVACCFFALPEQALCSCAFAQVCCIAILGSGNGCLL